MRDTIYRQDAVMEIANHLGMPAENWMKIAEEWLRDVPSAQPTQTNTSNALKSLDCISRQDAIDGFYEMASDIDHLCTVSDYVSFLESLSAQPEIIRCKDCLMHGVCRFEQGLGLDGYCSQAERRQE